MRGLMVVLASIAGVRACDMWSLATPFPAFNIKAGQIISPLQNSTFISDNPSATASYAFMQYNLNDFGDFGCPVPFEHSVSDAVATCNVTDITAAEFTASLKTFETTISLIPAGQQASAFAIYKPSDDCPETAFNGTQSHDGAVFSIVRGI